MRRTRFHPDLVGREAPLNQKNGPMVFLAGSFEWVKPLTPTYAALLLFLLLVHVRYML
jgi:hypothetical protein